ncbi:hypothetical protein PX699_00135 [Sphingobium sp. H39-3-25]|uniref:hypothetical protein n=1 Tax=Sphingobium arseniciresistens TaxID=3030834 RepID=UPI0023B8F433|nr:hypothetical protein [Sphingobium arseniciresistens]
MTEVACDLAFSPTAVKINVSRHFQAQVARLACDLGIEDFVEIVVAHDQPSRAKMLQERIFRQRVMQ